MTAPRILIVEDDALLGLDLKEHLEHAGFTVLGPADPPPKRWRFLLKPDAMRLSSMSTSAGGKPRSLSRKNCDCAGLRCHRHGLLSRAPA